MTFDDFNNDYPIVCDSDSKICFGLTLGDGGCGRIFLSESKYKDVSKDLIDDYHDFCSIHNLDRSEVGSARYFLKELKMKLSIKEINNDFD